jgi:RHS repeat-associated protein
LYFRHSDHLGSTSVLSDANGLRVEGSDVVYAPFGEIRIGEPSDLTDFGYTSQRLDSSTGGLMYYGARYYLPSLRRFISADTIVPGAGNPQNLNRYAYVLNNPINLIDPTGHRVPTDEEDERWGMGGSHSSGGSGGSSGSSGGNAAQGIGNATGGDYQDHWNAHNEDRGGSRGSGSATQAFEATLIWFDEHETRLYVQAVGAMADAMGGRDNLGAAMGSVTVIRLPLPIRSFALPGGLIFMTDLAYSSDEHAILTAVHEHGHIWDFNSGLSLSRGLAEEVGRTMALGNCSDPLARRSYWAPYIAPVERPICFQPTTPADPIAPGHEEGQYALSSSIEDFAQTFTGYVLPGDRNFITPYNVHGVRQEYIQRVIDELSE